MAMHKLAHPDGELATAKGEYIVIKISVFFFFFFFFFFLLQ